MVENLKNKIKANQISAIKSEENDVDGYKPSTFAEVRANKNTPVQTKNF